jgi:xanthine dehydrogenase YagS FAD-binding subunit
MRNFYHFDASSIAEAVALLGKTDDRTKDLTYGKVIAGGTDLIGGLRRGIDPTSPDFLVNIKKIDALKGIIEDAEGLHIGPLTSVEDCRTNPTIVSKYNLISQAATRTSTWELRTMGTIGGNICQETRCWYYRARRNRFNCIRKGGTVCYLQLGYNHFGSIFGGPGGCYTAHPSDLAPALISLDASLKITGKAGERIVKLEDFYTYLGNVLTEYEIITDIVVPTPEVGAKGTFLKQAIRKAIDFALVNVAVFISPGDARIVLGGVYPTPYRATAAEDVVEAGGTAEEAADAAVATAHPLGYNGYKVDIAKALVKRAITASM